VLKWITRKTYRVFVKSETAILFKAIKSKLYYMSAMSGKLQFDDKSILSYFQDKVKRKIAKIWKIAILILILRFDFANMNLKNQSNKSKEEEEEETEKEGKRERER
jgi:hypothetical protein